jgi:hypothetical protein
MKLFMFGALLRVSNVDSKKKAAWFNKHEIINSRSLSILHKICATIPGATAILSNRGTVNAAGLTPGRLAGWNKKLAAAGCNYRSQGAKWKAAWTKILRLLESHPYDSTVLKKVQAVYEEFAVHTIHATRMALKQDPNLSEPQRKAAKATIDLLHRAAVSTLPGPLYATETWFARLREMLKEVKAYNVRQAANPRGKKRGAPRTGKQPADDPDDGERQGHIEDLGRMPSARGWPYKKQPVHDDKQSLVQTKCEAGVYSSYALDPNHEEKEGDELTFHRGDIVLTKKQGDHITATLCPAGRHYVKGCLQRRMGGPLIPGVMSWYEYRLRRALSYRHAGWWHIEDGCEWYLLTLPLSLSLSLSLSALGKEEVVTQH